MVEPFRLLGRLILAQLKILLLFMVFLVEVVVSLATGGRNRLGDAVGEFGRAVVDAVTDIWR